MTGQQDQTARSVERPADSNVHDLNCIARIAAADVEALGDLYDRHGGVLYSLAFCILNRETEAFAVVIEAFGHVWREAPRHEAMQGSVRSWLLALTRRFATERLRTMPTPVGGQAAVYPSEPAKTDDEPERVRQALESLTDMQRAAIQKIYFEGLTLQESVRTLGTPLEAVKVELRCAFQKLRAAVRWGGQ